MAALILALTLLIPSLSFAVIPRDCRALEAAYRADTISQFEDLCFDDEECLARQMLQLREAAKERDPAYDATLDDQAIERRYGTDRTKLLFGDHVMDGVALYVGFVSSVSYYEKDSVTRAAITYEDGKVLIGGQRCDVPLGPYLSQARKENLCAASADYVDTASCLDDKNEFRIDNLSDDPTQAVISFGRSSEEDRVQLLCMGTVDRATDEVFDVTCLTPEDE